MVSSYSFCWVEGDPLAPAPCEAPICLQRELFAGASGSRTAGKDHSPQFGQAQCPGERLGERKCKNECVKAAWVVCLPFFFF